MATDPKRPTQKDEDELDRDLEDTFPASDPIDVTRIPEDERDDTPPVDEDKPTDREERD